jgi:hypothetical protein
MLSEDETLLSLIKNPQPLWAVFAMEDPIGDITIEKIEFMALIKSDRYKMM